MGKPILIVENEKDDRMLLTTLTRKAWSRVVRPIRAEEIGIAQNVNEALEILDAPSDLALVVLDLMLEARPSKEENGFLVLGAALQRSPRPAVIVITRAAGAFDRARQAGADAVLLKDSLYRTEKAEETLAEAIESSLGRAGRSDVLGAEIQLTYDKDNLELSASIEVIGESRLAILCQRLFGKTPFTLQYLAPGLSGSAVFKVLGDRPDFGMQIVKVSRDQDLLRRELAGRRAAGQAFPSAFGSFGNGPENPVEHMGWHAIASPLLTNCCTLLDEALASPPPGVVATRLRELLAHYHGIRQYPESRPPNEVLHSSLLRGRAARILRGIEELDGLGGAKPGEDSDTRLVIGFVREGRIGGLRPDEIPRTTVTTFAHGDLHARNVLALSGGGVRMIDPANMGRLHWAADPSRLLVDLVVSTLDHGRRSYSWDSLGEWTDAISCLFEPNGWERCLPVFERNTQLQEIIRVADQDWRVTKGSVSVARWEFDLTLVCELLRCVYRVQELTAPKRTAALRAAGVGLRAVVAGASELSS